ncbi:MAG: hypothetical protein ACLT8E_04290 [Akkermansia sp.]
MDYGTGRWKNRTITLDHPQEHILDKAHIFVALYRKPVGVCALAEDDPVSVELAKRVSPSAQGSIGIAAVRTSSPTKTTKNLQAMPSPGPFRKAGFG